MICLSERLKAFEKKAEEFIPEAMSKISINSFDMDEVCSEHPSLYLWVGVFHAESVELHEEAKLNAKRIRGETNLAIRSNPDKFDLPSVTESTVNAALDCSKTVVAAEKRKIKAQKLYLRVKNVYDAFDHRRSMINNIREVMVAGLIEPHQKARKTHNEDKYEKQLRGKGVRRGSAKKKP